MRETRTQTAMKKKTQPPKITQSQTAKKVSSKSTAPKPKKIKKSKEIAEDLTQESSNNANDEIQSSHSGSENVQTQCEQNRERFTPTTEEFNSYMNNIENQEETEQGSETNQHAEKSSDFGISTVPDGGNEQDSDIEMKMNGFKLSSVLEEMKTAIIHTNSQIVELRKSSNHQFTQLAKKIDEQNSLLAGILNFLQTGKGNDRVQNVEQDEDTFALFEKTAIIPQPTNEQRKDIRQFKITASETIQELLEEMDQLKDNQNDERYVSFYLT